MDRTIRLAQYSLLLGILILALKAGAYLLTGSVALYSDALESIINVVAAGAALFALSIARKPADAEHPYGHAKAEYFSAVLEGVLIVLAAISIIYSAYQDLQAPKPLEALGLGLLVSLGATLLNAGYGTYLIRTGRHLRSPALVADGQHLMTDVVTSGGVLVALGLVALTGWTILDPIMAILVALNILWVGGRLVRSSMQSLLDEAAPPETQALVRRLVAEHAEGALEAHDLRTRHAGRLTFIDFHLVVPEHYTVGQAHAICDRLEAVIEQEVPGSEVTIHVEPDSAAKHRGVLVL
ncbi:MULTISPECIES: cation diffusion facilitator family transporter [Deinococcus]|uniref:Putative cation efflux family protein, CzcD-like protein n=1 Tax=Deinococcus phoenicis TaxID=1476583 RepID=A0A016QJG8_9DEIO|nr:MULTISPECIES: cation diffusion facilitator family transporter [Deinococcus]EYB66320.1 putative cation efflux family protein, CzcD-like protein [Deinococcus phoenicis]MBI0445526.1 cation transporter [Deinococcus sp. DB0503]